jgi:hypothetical protein
MQDTHEYRQFPENTVNYNFVVKYAFFICTQNLREVVYATLFSSDIFLHGAAWLSMVRRGFFWQRVGLL